MIYRILLYLLWNNPWYKDVIYDILFLEIRVVQSAYVFKICIKDRDRIIFSRNTKIRFFFHFICFTCKLFFLQILQSMFVLLCAYSGFFFPLNLATKNIHHHQTITQIKVKWQFPYWATKQPIPVIMDFVVHLTPGNDRSNIILQLSVPFLIRLLHI